METNQPPLTADDVEADALESDLLAQVFERLDDCEIPVDANTMECVPFIMKGLMEGDFEADPRNHLHTTIGAVLRTANVLPEPPSALA